VLIDYPRQSHADRTAAPFHVATCIWGLLPRPQTVQALTKEVMTSPIQTYALVPMEESGDEERLEPTQGTPHTPHNTPRKMEVGQAIASALYAPSL